MPIFARRRLQAMLDDLGPLLTPPKEADLRARLEHRQTGKVLAAEFELGLLWAIGKVAHLTIQPELPGAAPDAISNDLFRSGPAIIEITALSDDTFSGEKDMNRAANMIAQFADRVRKGASEHLYFEFGARGYFDGRRYHRIRLISDAFQLTPAFKGALRSWLGAPNWPNPPAIRLKDQDADVIVRWKDFVHPKFRVFSSVPPIAYDLEKNPVFSALRGKGRKLKSFPADMLRCVFLGDAGCWMLHELRSLYNPTREATNGEQIIRHFLTKSSSVDMVCVFSATRRSSSSFIAFEGALSWDVHVYDRRQAWDEHEHSNLESLRAALPPPRLEGYRVRSLCQQGLFRPESRGWYVGASTTMRRSMSMSIKVSARRLQELLAGRITLQQFQQRTFGGGMPNQFDYQLGRGLTIQKARVEKAGLDEDDDFLVFDLGPDPAALPLGEPSTKG